MADLVGEAYVRITADTTPMRDAIERDGARLGKKMGRAYVNEFTKEVDKIADDRLRQVHTRLAAAMSDPKEFDRLAKNFDNPREAADHFRAVLVKLNKQHHMNAASLRQYTKVIDKWEESTVAANAAAIDMTRQREQEAQALLIQNKQLTNFFRLQKQGYQRIQVAQKAQARAAAQTRRALAETDEVIERHDVHWVNSARLIRANLDRTAERADRFSQVIGRAFGKGSRNNFVNWVGSMVGGMSRLAVGLLTFPAKALSHIVDSFGTGFSAAAAGGLGKFASIGKGLANVFGGKGGVIGAVAGAVVALYGFGKVLPGIVSLMSMLGGVVSSVVGSIGIGLTGALLAVIPASAGAIAAVGGLASIFTSFFQNADNADFVKNFMKPWKNFNESYYPEVRTFLTNVRGGFDDLIKDITPGMDDFFSGFQKKMNDRSTLRALGLWSDTIGDVAQSLSRAGTSFLSGITGFFVPVLPYAERLGDVIRGWGTDFDKWANSRGGQEKITGFMDKAWVAGDKVFRILGNIGGVIGDIAWGGENTGTTFLDQMLGKLQKLNDYLDTPKGQQAMEDWFGDVKQLGLDLGGVASSAGEIVASLNSPEGRQTAKDIAGALEQMGNAASGLAKAAGWAGSIIDALNTPLTTTWSKALFGESDPNTKPYTPPTIKSQQEDKTPLHERGAVRQKLATYLVNIDVDDALYRQKVAAIEAFTLTGKTIPIKGNEALWNATKNTVAAYIFTQKQVPISGNEAEWNATKGTIAAFVFQSKVVPIEVADKDVRNWISWWNNQSFNKTATIRYTTAGNLPNGGRDLRGGSTSGNSAAGRIVYGPHMGLTGEAGPEAIVPLDRPLHLVDPAVRALSAIAQGKNTGGMAAGGIAGRGSIVVEKGAIVVSSPHSDPALVAESVLDRLVALTG